MILVLIGLWWEEIDRNFNSVKLVWFFGRSVLCIGMGVGFGLRFDGRVGVEEDIGNM